MTNLCFQERIETLIIDLELKSHWFYDLCFLLGEPKHKIESLSANLATQIDVLIKLRPDFTLK